METTLVYPWPSQWIGTLAPSLGEETGNSWLQWGHTETAAHPPPSVAPSAQGGSVDLNAFSFKTVQFRTFRGTAPQDFMGFGVCSTQLLSAMATVSVDPEGQEWVFYMASLVLSAARWCQ